MSEIYPKFPRVDCLLDEPMLHADFLAKNPGALLYLEYPVEVECGRFEFYSIQLSN